MIKQTWTVYRWIRQQRFKKKWIIYKQLYQLSFDKTITIYTSVFGLAFFFFLYDWSKRYMPLIEGWQVSMTEWLWLIPSALLIRSVIQSYRLPGLRFTSAEMKLSRLPHEERHILWFVLAERVMLRLAVPILIGLLVGWFTPFTLSFTVLVASLYSVFSILLIVPQWKLFSWSLWMKLIFTAVSFLYVYVWRWLEDHHFLMGGLLLAGLIFAHLYLFKVLLNEINWARVMDVNDAAVWRMPLVGQATMVKIRPPKKYGLVRTFIRSRKAQKRFNQIESLYHRLWRKHMMETFAYTGRTWLACVALLAVVPFKVEWMIYVSVPLTVFVYSRVIASLFREQFHTESLFTTIPVEEKGWISTFLHWASLGMIPLAISFLVYGLWVSGNGLLFILPLMAYLVFLYIEVCLQVKIAYLQLVKRNAHHQWGRVIGYGIMIASLYNPYGSLVMLLYYGVSRWMIHKNRGDELYM